jgi:quercetin dioxygenase-like cupin family protein
MQPSIRRFVLAFLSVVGLCASGAFVSTVVAAEPALVVNLAGKFKPCPGAPPGCEHVMLRGDPQSEPFQKIYRFPKGWMFPKHWHISAENLEMVRGTLVLGSEGGREQTLRPGDYAYIPQTLVHWGSCPEECVFYLGVDGPDSFNVVEEKQ